MDVHDEKTRSYNMSRIRGKDTKPEIHLRKALHKKGFRYSLHSKKLPGKPDIVFRKYKTVVFVHGCFWHGHKGCKYFRIPKTNTEFWEQKINANRYRDEKVYKELKQSGWKVLTVWECELKPTCSENNINKIADMIKN